MIPIALIITASLPFLYVSFLEILFWPIAVIPKAKLAGSVMTHKGTIKLRIKAIRPIRD